MTLRPLFAVCVDEDGNITISPPNDGYDEDVFKKSYGAIGQMLEQLGQHIQRKEYPAFMVQRGFTHMVPLHDAFEHHPDIGCSCGGRLDVNNKTFVHHAMDGRGEYEKDSPNWTVVDIEPH